MSGVILGREHWYAAIARRWNRAWGDAGDTLPTIYLRQASGAGTWVPGSRNRATIAAAALLDGDAEALTRKAIELGLEGDTVALRLCLERLVPPRKDSPITIDLPPIASASDVVAASAAVLDAVGAGEISPDEAGRVMTLLTAHRAIVETSELADRIAALEATSAARTNRRRA